MIEAKHVDTRGLFLKERGQILALARVMTSEL